MNSTFPISSPARIPTSFPAPSGNTWSSLCMPPISCVVDGLLKKKLPLASSFFDGVQGVRQIVQPKQASFFQGLPVISFTDEEVSALAAPFALSLVGKFLDGVPHLSDIAPVFRKLQLKGSFDYSFLDNRHLLIRLHNEEDYASLWVKNSIFIGNCIMRLRKWSPYLNTSVDSPIVPVWVNLKKVPLMLFHPEALFELAKPLGVPLRVDYATANMLRLDRARICVEMDVSLPMLKSLCVDVLGHKISIEVDYKNVPLYCAFCHKIGHVDSSCYAKNPSLKLRRKVEGVSGAMLEKNLNSEKLGSIVEEVTIHNQSVVEGIDVVEEVVVDMSDVIEKVVLDVSDVIEEVVVVVGDEVEKVVGDVELLLEDQEEKELGSDEPSILDLHVPSSSLEVVVEAVESPPIPDAQLEPFVSVPVLSPSLLLDISVPREPLVNLAALNTRDHRAFLQSLFRRKTISPAKSPTPPPRSPSCNEVIAFSHLELSVPTKKKPPEPRSRMTRSCAKKGWTCC